MLVYRDLQFTTTLVALRRRLQRQYALSDPENLDHLRALLIQAGQFEQASADCLSSDLPGSAVASIQSLTDFAAAAFYAVWSRSFGETTVPGMTAREALECFASQLNRVRLAGHRKIVVKVPEGFAFYALFPDQYCVAILNWLKSRRAHGEKQAVVVGIRSIGTTLSAVVAACLRAARWNVSRMTVRPGGDVFSRQLPADWRAVFSSLAQGAVGGKQVATPAALVVDEGPGISGSSMVAVAKSLQAAGFPENRIWFLPGHSNGPGKAASLTSRKWWVSSRILFANLEEVRWNGLSLHEELARKTSEICGLECKRSEDLSHGKWRKRVFARSADWPATCGVFERMKVRCVLRDGKAVLWKYVGLGAWIDARTNGCAESLRQACNRAKTGFGPEALAVCSGFLGVRWIAGSALKLPALKFPRIQTKVVECLLAQSRWQPRLSASDQTDAYLRLRKVLFTNLQEMLREENSPKSSRIEPMNQMAPKASSPSPSPRKERAGEGMLFSRFVGRSSVCANGDMAACNWVQDRSGELFKTGASLSDGGHTIIGRQPIAWDIAAAIVDWQLSPRGEERFLSLLFKHGIGVCTPVLEFYKMAYAAFRVGQLEICIQWQSRNSREQKRLVREASRYKEFLRHAVEKSRAVDA